jgi:hypothetical protein
MRLLLIGVHISTLALNKILVHMTFVPFTNIKNILPSTFNSEPLVFFSVFSQNSLFFLLLCTDVKLGGKNVDLRSLKMKCRGKD